MSKQDQKPVAKPKKEGSGYYWVDKKITCNGCKYLNFYKCGCKRNQPANQVRPLDSYMNGDNFKAILRPSDCDYKKDTESQDNLEEKKGVSK